jgi:uncharacterized surface protein with fasciclin (FAS1) repeats
MKNAERNKHFLSLLIILGLVLLSTDCSKTDNSYTRINTTPRDTAQSNPPNQVGTIVDEIFGDSAEYRILKNIIIRSGTETLLGTLGPFTFFAPKDWTFDGTGINLQTIPGIPVDTLKKIIYFLLFDGRITISDFHYDPIDKLISKGGDSLFVDRSLGIVVNGSPLNPSDLIVSNGIIHPVLGLLIPPAGDIMQTLKLDTSCSYFFAALLRASTGTFDIASELGKDIYTLFAPNNQAFRSAGFNSIHDLESISPDSLSNILQYHIVRGRVLNVDLIGQNTIREALNGKNLKISYRDPDAPPDPMRFQLSIEGNPYYPKASFYKINKIATNGIIHEIDQVMIP